MLFKLWLYYIYLIILFNLWDKLQFTHRHLRFLDYLSFAIFTSCILNPGNWLMKHWLKYKIQLIQNEIHFKERFCGFCSVCREFCADRARRKCKQGLMVTMQVAVASDPRSCHQHAYLSQQKSVDWRRSCMQVIFYEAFK